MSTADKLLTIAENIPKVYNAGYEKGKAEGGDSYYDEYWDSKQENGNAISYDCAFYGRAWNINTFKPKYNIIPTSAEKIFHSAMNIDFDMVEHLNSLGLTMDFSQCTNFQYMIYNCRVKRLGVIDMSKVSSSNNANNVFRGSGVDSNYLLERIDELIVSSKYPISTSSFSYARRLTYIRIGGTITGSFTISSSPLDLESAKSVISHLENYAGTDKEFYYSVKFSDITWEYLNADNTAPNGGTWAEYIDSIGWSI